jgi:hypothetical protein
MKQDWIDIKDKLPELNQEILVLEQDYDITGKHYYSHLWIARYISYGRKRYFVQSLGYDKHNKRSSWAYPDVTHWMPLPNKIRTI